MTTPAIVRPATVLAGRLHDAPANVIVTVRVTVVAVAVQLAKPAPSVTVGVAGTLTNAEGNTTVSVLLEEAVLNAPDALVVKPTLHVDVAPAVWGDPLKVTLPGELPPEIVTLPGDAVVASVEVFTVKPELKV